MINMMKLAKEYRDYKGFTVKPLQIYGDVNGIPMVITSVPYAYTESTDEIHLWILEDGKWILEYIDAYLLKEVELDLGIFNVDLLDFINAMQWTLDPEELQDIYYKSNIMGCVITTYRNMYGLWTIEEIFEM